MNSLARALKHITSGGYELIFIFFLGDVNCSHKEIDHCEPYEDFHLKPSRQWMDHLLHNKSSEEDLDWKIINFPEKYSTGTFEV